MVAAMTREVIVDVTRQGGCLKLEMTSHEKPVFLPSACPYCVRPSAMYLCCCLWRSVKRGLDNLVWHKFNIRNGIYLFKGSLTNIHLSQRFNLKYTDLNLLIATTIAGCIFRLQVAGGRLQEAGCSEAGCRRQAADYTAHCSLTAYLYLMISIWCG
jgi:hypothetical protein